RSAGGKASRCRDATRRRRSAPRRAQSRLHHAACLAEIHLAGVRLLERSHHLAHVLDAGGACRLDGFSDRRFRLGIRHLAREKRPDDLDLAALLAGELVAAGLVVDLRRLLALLDQLLQQREEVVVGERSLLAGVRLDIGVLDRSIHQPQRRYAALVAGFHGALEGSVDLVAQHGYGLSRNWPPASRTDNAAAPPTDLGWG